MDHLYPSAFRVERLQLILVEDGVPITDWAQATSETGDQNENDMLAFLRGRLDLMFIRPGKDIPLAPEAGKAPDRMGILFTFPYAPIRAGDRIVAIPNANGKMPVKGTFEIRPKPDEAQGYDDTHHLEIQVIEVGQNLDDVKWPGEDPE
ncbi:hypothetical protein SEA_MAGRITTE_28 [Microbacterium phage Magritte]|nr:hypothetical protein SEA_MAGRITTE_28 [Microbacterium phage Magritte]